MMEVFQEHKRDIIAIAVIFALLCISIGYAALSSNLTINGASQIKDAVWDIHWENIQVTSGSVTVVSAPTIDTNKTTVSYEVHFDTPGEFYEFTVDAKNAGTINGMINTINSTLNGNPISTLPNYFNYNVSYSDGVPIQVKQELNAGTTETYKVRIEYKKDISVDDLPSTDQDLVLSFTVTYVQKDSSAIVVGHPAEFATDSWETIISAIQSGNTSAYHVGDTKSIDLGTYGTHSLRISNMSTPEECNQDGFSQTACGFVLEFVDGIASYKMNPINNSGNIGDGNIGGWENCMMRSFLNTTIYNSLPSDLKNGIIDTTVISGHGPNDSNNFTTTDKIYLLDMKELEGSNYIIGNTALEFERQLDYYQLQGGASSAYAKYRREHELCIWWLRSSNSFRVKEFGCVTSYGIISTCESSNSTYMASPAFRIG